MSFLIAHVRCCIALERFGLCVEERPFELGLGDLCLASIAPCPALSFGFLNKHTNYYHEYRMHGWLGRVGYMHGSLFAWKWLTSSGSSGSISPSSLSFFSLSNSFLNVASTSASGVRTGVTPAGRGGVSVVGIALDAVGSKHHRHDGHSTFNM